MTTEPERYTVVRGKNHYHVTVTTVHDPEAIREVDEFLLRCLLAKLPEIYARRARGEIQGR